MIVPSIDHNPGSSHVHGVTGIILAGGRSTRYGSNKAMAEVDGRRLIERVVTVMETVFQRLILVTNTPEEYAYLELPMIQDLIKGLGPLGGLYTGLESLSDEAGFFVACDMPFLNGPLIRHMVQVRGRFDAVVPKIDWMLEPLHALYTRDCLPAIKVMIDSRQYQIMKFFEKITVRFLVEDEIRAFDPSLRSLFNVNRPEELAGSTESKG